MKDTTVAQVTEAKDATVEKTAEVKEAAAETADAAKAEKKGFFSWFKKSAA